MQGALADALKGADVFVGVSKPNLVTDEMVHSMNEDPIIFAMANPEPKLLIKSKSCRSKSGRNRAFRLSKPNQ